MGGRRDVYWGGSSGSQEAPIYRQHCPSGHAAAVAEQEEDGVHHIVHLCGRRQVRGCPAPPLTSSACPQRPYLPANLPRGMRSSMALAFWGSLQLACPMGVMTTVGFTAFTRICSRTGRRWVGAWMGAGRREAPGTYLVGPQLQRHHLGQHVQGALGGACKMGKERSEPVAGV